MVKATRGVVKYGQGIELIASLARRSRIVGSALISMQDQCRRSFSVADQRLSPPSPHNSTIRCGFDWNRCSRFVIDSRSRPFSCRTHIDPRFPSVGNPRRISGYRGLGTTYWKTDLTDFFYWTLSCEYLGFCF